MDELKLKVSAFQKDLGLLAKELAEKHGLSLTKNFLKYDSIQYKSSLVFAVKGKEAEVKQARLSNYGYQESDPKVGEVVNYRRTGYKVLGFNRAGNLVVSRVVDNREFKFKRNRLNGLYDYFDKVAVSA